MALEEVVRYNQFDSPQYQAMPEQGVIGTPVFANADHVSSDSASTDSITTRNAERINCSQPNVRAATRNDAEALARIELSAYADVYGHQPTQETVEQVTRKYQERVELLADEGLVRILETSESGPYGMIVCCRTNCGQDAFLANGQSLDMTDNNNLRHVYDPNGVNGYIINLAVMPGHGRHEGQLLMADAMMMGIENGVQQVFFESRMPGFEAWYGKLQSYAAEQGLPAPNTLEDEQWFADQYWRLQRKNGQPIDPLLAYYVRTVNAQPLGLVKDAWKPDHPSGGYGVLCSLRLPSQEQIETTSATPESVSKETTESVEATGEGVSLAAFSKQDESPNGAHRVLEWINGHKGEVLMLGSAAVAAVLLHMSGQEGQLVENIQGQARPWLIAWGGSLAVYGLTGLAFGLSAATYAAEHAIKKVPLVRNLISENSWHRAHVASRWLMEKSFAVNFAAAVAAAGFFGMAVNKGLPSGEAQMAGYVAAGTDLYITLASRAAIARAWLRRRTPTNNANSTVEV